MANNFDSNITRKLLRIFLPMFESMRVLSKCVDTQLLSGVFNPASGENVDFKRPTDYVSVETQDGDITNEAYGDIVTGKATGTVQDFITVPLQWTIREEALHMDQQQELIRPAAQRLVTSLELKFAKFMMANAGLLSGVHGQGVSKWSHVARAKAVMTSHGVPHGSWHYAVNPYTQVALADAQGQLQAGGEAGKLVKTAFEKADIVKNFGGMNVKGAVTLANYMIPNLGGDLIGAVNGVVNCTYLEAKDKFTQTIPVDGLNGNRTLKAGTMIKIGGPKRLHLQTRQLIFDMTGATVDFTGTLVKDAEIVNGSGNLEICGPAIYEANGAFNTVDRAIADNAIVTILGAQSTNYQPNLFWDRLAYSIGSVEIPEIGALDNWATTEDGISIRCTLGGNIETNKNTCRFDILPAFAALNPFMAGHGFGLAQ